MKWPLLQNQLSLYCHCRRGKFARHLTLNESRCRTLADYEEHVTDRRALSNLRALHVEIGDRRFQRAGRPGK